MKALETRSIGMYYFLNVITFGIYGLVFWSKLAKDVETVCAGDGQKTIKYMPSWLLSIITLGIFGIVWKAKVAKRLQANAERYSFRYSEGGGLTALYSVFCYPLAHFIIIKNFNKMAKAFNEYNDLADDSNKVDLFAD